MQMQQIQPPQMQQPASQALTAIRQTPPPPLPPGWAPGAPAPARLGRAERGSTRDEAAQLRTSGSARPDADHFDNWRFLLRAAISGRCPALEARCCGWSTTTWPRPCAHSSQAYRDTAWKAADEWLSRLIVSLIDWKTPDGSNLVAALSVAQDGEQRSGASILLRMRDDVIPQDLLSANVLKRKVDETAYFDLSMSRREVTAAGVQLRRDIERMRPAHRWNDRQLFALRTLVEKYPRPHFDRECIADLQMLDRHIRCDAPLTFTFDDRVDFLAAHIVGRRLA